MKKLLFILEGISQDNLQKWCDSYYSEKEVIFVNSIDFKILQVGEGEVVQIYPEQEYKEKIEEFDMGYSKTKTVDSKIIPKEEVRHQEIIEPSKNMVPKEKEWEEVKKYSRNSRYPKEMDGFVEEHMNQHQNKELCELIEKEYDLEISTGQLTAFMQHRNLKREKKIYQSRESKFPQEMKEFVEENINKYKNSKLTEMIKQRFDLEITKNQLENYLTNKRIKRTKGTPKDIEDIEDIEEEPTVPTANSYCPDCEELEDECTCEELIGEDYESEEQEESIVQDELKNPYDVKINKVTVPLEIMEFIKNNEKLDPIVLRDEIIVMFERNYKLPEIRMMQSQFYKENKILPTIDS